MIHWRTFGRSILALLAMATTAVLAAGLNDTGVGANQCVSGGVLDACTAATTGDAAPEPRQDGRFGRDAAAASGQLTKTGAGAAGFDFTPLDGSGNPIAIVGGVPASTPACVHDNVTNLTWEVKTAGNMNDTYTWANATAVYAAAVNSAGLCGSHAVWRLPTRRELLSIVHYGANSPAIDANFFPNTVTNWFWTSDVYVPAPTLAWLVGFGTGTIIANDGQAYPSPVRLVRSGQ
jgi:hypothetical protein